MKATEKMDFSSKESFKKHDEDEKSRGNLPSPSKNTTTEKTHEDLIVLSDDLESVEIKDKSCVSADAISISSGSSVERR